MDPNQQMMVDGYFHQVPPMHFIPPEPAMRQDIIVPAGYEAVLVPIQPPHYNNNNNHHHQLYHHHHLSQSHPSPPPMYPLPPMQPPPPGFSEVPIIYGEAPENPFILHESHPKTRHDTSKSLANNALIWYILGIFTWFLIIPSIVCSMRLAFRGLVKRKGLLYICSVIELIAWLAVPATSWMTVTKCTPHPTDSYDYVSEELQCDRLWVGWITILVWEAVTLLVGIPRMVLSSQYEKYVVPSAEEYPNPDGSYEISGSGYPAPNPLYCMNMPAGHHHHQPDAAPTPPLYYMNMPAAQHQPDIPNPYFQPLSPDSPVVFAPT